MSSRPFYPTEITDYATTNNLELALLKKVSQRSIALHRHKNIPGIYGNERCAVQEGKSYLRGGIIIKSRKIIILFLALLLVFPVSGCEGGHDIGTPPNNSGTEKNGGKAVTLKYYTIGAPDSDLKKVNNALNKLLEEKIGIRIEYNKIDWSSYGESLSNIINSGTDFDLAFAAGTDQGDYVGNAGKGAWLELSPYLETLGKEMCGAINPLLWEGLKINGKVYGVPTNKEIAVPEWWLYSKELVEKYKIDISKYTTLESLEPIFHEIKQREPEYTVMELDKASHNFFALENYEYLFGRSIPLMVQSTDKSLKVVNIFEMDIAVKTLDTLRKYYKAGYINEDAAVREEGKGLEQDRKVFWRGGSGGPFSNASWSKDIGYDVVAQQVSDSIVTTESARGGIMVVSSRTRNTEACIRFLNCLNTDAEIRNMMNFGIEGLHYDLTPEGQVAVKKDSGYTGIQYTQGNWFILRTMKGDPLNKWEEYKRFNSTAIQSEALNFTPDISSVKAQIAAVSRVTYKYYAGLMTGTVDPQTVLPNFIKELKSTGIEDLKKDFQQQITIWKNRK